MEEEGLSKGEDTAWAQVLLQSRQLTWDQGRKNGKTHAGQGEPMIDFLLTGKAFECCIVPETRINQPQNTNLFILIFFFPFSLLYLRLKRGKIGFLTKGGKKSHKKTWVFIMIYCNNPKKKVSMKSSREEKYLQHIKKNMYIYIYFSACKYQL